MGGFIVVGCIVMIAQITIHKYISPYSCIVMCSIYYEVNNFHNTVNHYGVRGGENVYRQHPYQIVEDCVWQRL